MRRRTPWFEWLLIGLLLVIIAGDYLLDHVAPPYLQALLQRIAGHVLTVERVQLDLPRAQLILHGASIHVPDARIALTSRRVALKPRWLSWRTHTVWVDHVTLDGVQLRAHRTAQGTLIWPTLDALFGAASTPEAASTEPITSDAPQPAWHSPWRVVLDTVQLVDAHVELIDEKPGKPFHGAIAQLNIVAGPLEIPHQVERFSLAIQGRLVGEHDESAAAYCSGWANLARRSIDLSCRLEPLRLAAFDSYYPQGKFQARPYDAKLQATAHFLAKDNQLDGRVQVTILNISEADLSYLGRTIVDFKKLTSSADDALTSEIQIVGPLDDPGQWQTKLVPGNEIVQRLIKPLLERGRESVQIRLGPQTIPLELSPGSEAEMTEILEGSKQIEQSLELLRTTTPATQPTGEAADEAADQTSSSDHTPPAASTPSARSPRAPASVPANPTPAH